MASLYMTVQQLASHSVASPTRNPVPQRQASDYVTNLPCLCLHSYCHNPSPGQSPSHPPHLSCHLLPRLLHSLPPGLWHPSGPSHAFSHSSQSSFPSALSLRAGGCSSHIVLLLIQAAACCLAARPSTLQLQGLCTC